MTDTATNMTTTITRTGSAALDRFIKQAIGLGLNVEVVDHSEGNVEQFAVDITRQQVEVKNLLDQINNHESLHICAIRSVGEFGTKRWGFRANTYQLFSGSDSVRFNIIKWCIEGMVR